MGQFVTFGLVPPWVVNWLTPIWLLSVGITTGLLVLLACWAVVFVLSRIPGLGTIGEDRRRAQMLAIPVGALLLVAVLPAMWNSLATNWFFGFLIPAALVAWYVAFALLMLVWRRSADEIALGLSEGVLKPISVIAMCFVAFAVFGSFIVREPASLINSLTRLPETGVRDLTREVPVDPRLAQDEFVEPKQEEITLDFRQSELKQLKITSDQRVSLSPQPFDETPTGKTWELSPDEEFTWNAGDEVLSPFPDEQIDKLYAMNRGSGPATLSIVADVRPTYPEVATIPVVAISVVMLYLLYFAQRATMPKLSAIALSTSKSEIAQPLFAILVTIGAVALMLFIWIPYNTLGEDIKMLKNTGLPLIMVLAIFQAIWAASTSVAEEIEGRTALTVLSKPVGRRSFIVGKFVGISWTVALMFIILSAVFLIVIAYKPIYDAKESSAESPGWELCHFEMVRTVPGLALAFMETIVFAALSVAISTRLPLLANIVVCFSVYVLGHLTPLLVQTTQEGFEIVKFIAQFIATIVPNLETFNIQAAIAGSVAVPLAYLGWAFVYCLIFSVIAMMLALFMFEDRDLA